MAAEARVPDASPIREIPPTPPPAETTDTCTPVGTGRPVTYRRNDAYLEWKRVQALATAHTSADLLERIDQLIEEDEAFQTEYGVPDPDAVTTADLPIDDHEALHDRWEDLTEWPTVRRDFRLLRRAVERAETAVDDGVQA